MGEIHQRLDEWVDTFPPEFIIEREAQKFVEAMLASHPDEFAEWMQQVAPSIVANFMRTKVSIRRRNARKMAALAGARALAGHPEDLAAAGSVFASMPVSLQTGDGRYAELRRLTKSDLLRNAHDAERMMKGHMRRASLYHRLAALLPTEDAVLGDYVTDDTIAQIAQEAEKVAG